MSNSTKTFVFALLMCTFCSLLLAAAAVGLKPAQERNKLVDRQKNVLKCLDLLDKGKSYAADTVQDIYKNSIYELYLDSADNLIENETDRPVFVVKKDNVIDKYAVPFEAYGLWSWIKGYIALDGDGETIVGLTVYSHAETPGLGGECEKDWFQDQFIGKKITNINNEFVSISIVKGKVKDANVPDEALANYVDGMSGATITSKGIESYLKEDLMRYESFSKSLRQG